MGRIGRCLDFRPLYGFRISHIQFEKWIFDRDDFWRLLFTRQAVIKGAISFAATPQLPVMLRNRWDVYASRT
jgi:hypothetical protein